MTAPTHAGSVYAETETPRNDKQHKSPDIKKMTEIIISPRTKIYVEKGRDPETARLVWLENHANCSY